MWQPLHCTPLQIAAASINHLSAMLLERERGEKRTLRIMLPTACKSATTPNNLPLSLPPLLPPVSCPSESSRKCNVHNATDCTAGCKPEPREVIIEDTTNRPSDELAASITSSCESTSNPTDIFATNKSNLISAKRALGLVSVVLFDVAAARVVRSWLGSGLNARINAIKIGQLLDGRSEQKNSLPGKIIRRYMVRVTPTPVM